jgi:UDP-2,3-diacylglucosamine pyrophosphatase LpxH
LAERMNAKGADLTEDIRSRSDEFNIAIISDLHLSEGRNPSSKKFNLNEDFFFDEEFERFLAYLESESERRGRKWRLIIAGDMVDFLQITRLPESAQFELRRSEAEYGLGTQPDKTIWKMKVMMEGHWNFFRGLGRFIWAGNKCTIMTGNHDIEWTVPQVQTAFREMMKGYLPDEAIKKEEVVSSQIEFCPWFYYEPGLIWVEHGNQYDSMNSFDYFLFPYLPGNKELMLPGGSFFVRYLFNKVEQIDPFADNIKPLSSYLKKYFLKLLFSISVLKHLRHFLKILGKIKKFKTEETAYLSQKNDEEIKSEAQRFRIDIERLKAIKRHWVASFLYSKGKLENIIKFFTYKTGGIYEKRASMIQKQLDVRYVVFGHTHEVELRVLNSNGKAEYSNSGTWIKIFSSNPSERLLREDHESVFVQILKDDANKLDLLKWRDDIGLGERVKLFEKAHSNKG